MSTFKVEVVKINLVKPHPTSDHLDLALVNGWTVVVKEGQYRTGDVVVFFPIDSLLPAGLERVLFPPESKVRLTHGRVKAAKIRGVVSQGLIASLDQLGIAGTIGDDLTDSLGVEKYEPPETFTSAININRRATDKDFNPLFKKYTDIENIANFNDVFENAEQVYITEKLNGCSARYGVLPKVGTGVAGLYRRLKQRLGIENPSQYVYGSRNLQLQSDVGTDESVYGKIGQKMLFHTLPVGVCIYGEIIGDGIQKGYSYGCMPGEHRFYAYDVQMNGLWLDSAAFMDFCDRYGIPRVPKLYVGPYSKIIEYNYRQGPSMVDSATLREGVVIKPLRESKAKCGRKVLKSINDDFLLNQQ